MTKLWYNYPKVLFDNPYQFFPSNNLSEIEAGLTESNNSSGFVGSENPSNQNQ